MNRFVSRVPSTSAHRRRFRRARLIFLMLPLVLGWPGARASTTAIFNSSQGEQAAGGYYAVAEYGPDYALATIQGVMSLEGVGRFINSSAYSTLDLYYRLDGSSTAHLQIGYSLWAEATQLLSNVTATAWIEVFEYDPGWGDVGSAKYSDSIPVNLSATTSPGSGSGQRTDHTAYLWNWNTSRDVHIRLSARTTGYIDRYYSLYRETYFSASAYADPQLDATGATVTPYNEVTQVVRNEESWLIPEPSIAVLLGLGFIGWAVGRTRSGPVA